jgi:hypothetical protein
VITFYWWYNAPQKKKKVLGYALGITRLGLEPDLHREWFFKNPKPLVLKCEELGPKLDQRFYQFLKILEPKLEVLSNKI